MTGNRYRKNNSVGIVEEGRVNNSVDGVMVMSLDSKASRAGIRSSVNEASEIV